MAYNVLTGGTRLEDIERLRHDVAYMNALGADLIPDPTTAGDFCRRFTEDDVTALMDAINAVRPQLWAGRGRDLLGPVAYVDVDGRIVATTGSYKQGMDISYKGIWGYAPLLVTLANTREVLFLVNRPGNAPSHQDAAGWIDKAIDLVVPHAPRVCLRGDTDFSLTEHLDRWAERVDFVLGMDNNAALRRIAEGLDPSAWNRLHRPAPYRPSTGKRRARRDNRKRQIVKEREYLNLELNHEDVATFTYQPRKCKRGYRVVALRKNISRIRGENVLVDEIRYFFYITTYIDKTSPEIVALANDRCDQENHRPAQVRHQRPAGAALRPGQQLGLHAHRRTGLEHQGLVRHDDASQDRPARLHPHGVPPLLPQRHPHPRHDPAQGPQHHRPAGRLHPSHGPALQRMDHHRTPPLRLTPSPAAPPTPPPRTRGGDPTRNPSAKPNGNQIKRDQHRPRTPPRRSPTTRDHPTTKTIHPRSRAAGHLKPEPRLFED
jgi:Transposase DDE domain group 1